MKVAVLGARGFIGSYIVENLRNHLVIPVTRDTLDLTDFQKVREWLMIATPDVIINCATSGGKQTLGEVNYSDVQNNLAIFLNFYNNRRLFQKFINVGSGAEFDRDNNLDEVSEDSLTAVVPVESYGYSKNIIARMCLGVPEFYTLRLFGCFDASEPEFRLLKRFRTNPELEIQDRQFDFISLSDFIKVIDHVIKNSVRHQDINCVYDKKIRLSEFLTLYCQVNGLVPAFKVTGYNKNNYTGDSSKLQSLGIKLDGLVKGLMEYESS